MTIRRDVDKQLEPVLATVPRGGRREGARRDPCSAMRPRSLPSRTGNGAAMVVIGTHGRTGIKKLVMGSVASQVIATAPCPVLTVH